MANGRDLKSTALTTENTAMLAPTVRVSVETTANAKPGWRRNWRMDAWRIIFPLSEELHRIPGDLSNSATIPPKSDIALVPACEAF